MYNYDWQSFKYRFQLNLHQTVNFPMQKTFTQSMPIISMFMELGGALQVNLKYSLLAVWDFLNCGRTRGTTFFSLSGWAQYSLDTRSFPCIKKTAADYKGF